MPILPARFAGIILAFAPLRYLGEVDASPESMCRLVKRLAAKHERIHFCYEAGPTDYGLYRLITDLGHPCMVSEVWRPPFGGAAELGC